jgi:hypothetical protein
MAQNKPMFTNKEAGYKTPYLNAKKKSGKGDTAVYETEEECRARVKDMFDIDDVECFWDEENNRFVAGPMPGLDAEAKPADDEPEAKDDKPEPVEEVAEKSKAKKKLKKEKDETKMESPDPETADEEPKTDESDFPTEHNDSEPKPSEDGTRTYDLSTSRGLQNLKGLLNKWAWDEGEAALKAKLDEEIAEMRSGGNEGFTKDGSNVSVIGTSFCSEMITVAIIIFKLADQFYDITPVDFAKLMHLRHQEQYERYQHLHKEDF